LLKESRYLPDTAGEAGGAQINALKDSPSYARKLTKAARPAVVFKKGKDLLIFSADSSLSCFAALLTFAEDTGCH
jgi:hypothetical protein